MTEQFNKAQEQTSAQLSLFDEDYTKNLPSPAYEIETTVPSETLIYLLAISSVKGIGFKTLCQMYDNRLLWDLWHLNNQELGERCKSLSNKTSREIITALHSDKQKLLELGKSAAKDLYQRGISFIDSKAPYFPKAFFRLQEPPRWIFVKGNLDVLHSESIIAIVGTREPSYEGQNLARRCAEELAKRNFIVLSGLARGIDESVHNGAVSYFGQTIAVLGYGHQTEDAYHNKLLASKILELNGAIVTEYMPNDPPARDRFLRRNELVVALSKAVIPIETPSLESGTGATIRRALKIKTQVIGITSPYLTSKTLDETKANLVSLNIPIFSVGNGSNEFWNKLGEIYPDHNWNISPEARQEQFFKQILKQVEEIKDKISLDSTAVDRLAEQIKKIL